MEYSVRPAKFVGSFVKMDGVAVDMRVLLHMEAKDLSDALPPQSGSLKTDCNSQVKAAHQLTFRSVLLASI